MPIDLYAIIGRYQRATKIRAHQVEKKISDTADVVRRSIRSAGALGIRPLTNRELTIAKVDELIEKAET
jgi:hypothetical protein